MGQLRVITPKEGDVRLSWDVANREQVREARKTFEDLTGKGYYAYRVGKSGRKGEVIRAFEPDAEEIIIAPPMAGG